MPSVNLWSVILAAIASMVLGFIWFGPLFGKTWMRLMGWGPDHMHRMGEEGKKSAQRGYIFTFIGSLVMAYVLSHFITFATNYFDTEGWSAGVSAGFWAWLGFIAPVTLSGVLWEGKSWRLWIFNNGYNLIQVMVMGAIIAGMM